MKNNALSWSDGLSIMEIFAWMSDSSFGVWVRESTWAYPGLLFLHTLGLGALVGLSSVLDFRLLGVAPRVPLDAMEPLFPYMWAGFWVNAVSGALLFFADAPKKVVNPAFLIKMVLIVLAVMNMRAVKRRAFSTSPPVAEGTLGHDAKVLAAISLALWVGAVTAGRLMAYTTPIVP